MSAEDPNNEENDDVEEEEKDNNNEENLSIPQSPILATRYAHRAARLVRSPEIEEARCRMKLRDIQGQRRRYEVDVNIITPYRRHTYTNMGWDLAKMFDQMSDSLKNQLGHKRSGRQKESVRHRTV
jgi:hypothetical protein